MERVFSFDRVGFLTETSARCCCNATLVKKQSRPKWQYTVTFHQEPYTNRNYEYPCSVAHSFILSFYGNGIKGRQNRNYNLKCYLYIERFVETNEVFRSRRSKNRLYNGNKKKVQTLVYMKLQKKTKNWETWILLKIFHISKILQPSLKWRFKCADKSARVWIPCNFKGEMQRFWVFDCIALLDKDI